MRVLVVDDSPGLRRALARALREVGQEVTTAGSGTEALRVVEHRHFDVVVSDVQMPGMGGVELAERLSPYFPILLMTGSTDPLHTPHKVLSKPFRVEVLLEAMTEAVQAKHRSSGVVRRSGVAQRQPLKRQRRDSNG